jgi:hypothetical protein
MKAGKPKTELSSETHKALPGWRSSLILKSRGRVCDMITGPEVPGTVSAS